MKIRDRIVELRRVPAKELIPNPANWRKHPEAQQNAMRGILSEVGFVDALMARETPEGLMLIDGHLRAETAPDAEVPVIVVDLNEAEAAKILATFDPLSAMAETDAVLLDQLLREVETGSEALSQMLADLADDAGLYGDIDEAEAPALADGDREPFQQMTFTLHDEQAELINEALDKAKDAGPFEDSPNQNSNGNALARIAEAYVGQG